MLLEQFKPSHASRAWHITAEYGGRRYFITSTPWLNIAERVALDYVAAYPDARFFTGDCWSKSISIDGTAQALREAYNGQV